MPHMGMSRTQEGNPPHQTTFFGFNAGGYFAHQCFGADALRVRVVVIHPDPQEPLRFNFHSGIYLFAAAKAVAAIRTMLGCRVPSLGIWPCGAWGGTEK